MFTTGMMFHHKDNDSVTYTVEKVDYKSQTLHLSFFMDEQKKHTQSYLPDSESLLNKGIWIKGEGSDKMTLVLHSGEKVLVDTTWLTDNQFNTVGRKRVHDFEIAQILNDKRDMADRGHWAAWAGVKPKAVDLFKDGYQGLELVKGGFNNSWIRLKGFESDYTLECNISSSGGYYYRFCNHGKFGSFDFIFKDGVFYECSKMHYRKLCGKGGKTLAHHLNKKVTKKAQQQLIDFFNNHYKEV